MPPGAGALYFDDGRIRKTELGEEFSEARAELLDSTKRMLVDLRRVSDPGVPTRARGQGGLGHGRVMGTMRYAHLAEPRDGRLLTKTGARGAGAIERVSSENLDILSRATRGSRARNRVDLRLTARM